MKRTGSILSLWGLLLLSVHSPAQDGKQQLANANLLSDSMKYAPADTLKTEAVSTKPLLKHDPRVATRRSAIIPGWGQAYNREYWKIPLVYGIIAIPVGLFIYNNNYYNKTKFAYEARYKELYSKDSSDVALIDPQLKNLSITSLQNYRNSFRRDRDYSVLWFLFAWGLQVVDATVFAHLKQFDVSNDLSMQVKPVINVVTRTPGVSLTLNLRNRNTKPVDAR
jgi:hypothetical protein